MILGIILWGIVFTGIIVLFRLFNTLFTILATIFIIISIFLLIVIFILKYIFKKKNFLTKSYFETIRDKGYSKIKIFLLKSLKWFLTIFSIGLIINIIICYVLMQFTKYNYLNNKDYDVYIDKSSISIEKELKDDGWYEYDIKCRVINDERNEQWCIGDICVGVAYDLEEANQEVKQAINENFCTSELDKEYVDFRYEEYLDVSYKMLYKDLHNDIEQNPYIWFVILENLQLYTQGKDSNLENNYAIIENPYYDY